MKTENLFRIIAVLALSTLLFACGGGGGSGNSTVSQGKVVNGVAQAGIFTKGKVVFKGYSGSANTKEYTITFTNFSSPQGAFKANIGDYSGPLKINVSGYYMDEATHKVISVTEGNPLKAAIPQSSVSDGVIVPVTPLTDIAANKALQAPGGISNDSITQNNKGVAQLFGLTDVTKTIPVAPTAANLSSATASSEQTYAVALVKLSEYVAQYAATSSGATTSTVTSDVLQTAMPAALAQFSDGIKVTAGTGTGTTPTVTITAPELKDTLTNIMQNNSITINNAPVTLSSAATGSITGTLNTAGSTLSVKKYNLNVTGSSAASIYGIQVDIAIPDSVKITTDSNGVVSMGSVTSAISGGIINGTFKNSILKLTFAAGTANLTNGVQLATIVCQVTGSAALTPSNIKALDKNGNPLTGINVTAAPA